ncbi:MAG: CRISPR-associated endonuclease Cas1 [Fusobacterium perfoetens]|uniref:CRISPR-associated endonuclease Cas1 n=1 Tax=Fusobacterium perfoetens TaxID=852 RepID=UPI0023EFB080|nr:CRISPR-associated endonuclease Cas1 [Fusobacterium perfoetens]MCI6152338.1 CRISPR-associated endonuclease Cas1 [Fusobacterium perfoetens]MDY3236937.1 CRISPR-associated endonuclease Cas1 [Fusobacterium perfoetens]
MEVYIQEKGSSLRREKEHFIIESKGKINHISPEKITNIIIEDNSIISTNAIKLAVENDIPIFLSDGIGNIYGKVWKPHFGKNSLVRLKQLKVFNSKYGNSIGKEWIILKLESQKKHIMKIYKRRNKDYTNEVFLFDNIINSVKQLGIEKENFSNTIMGYEGNGSRLYYSLIAKMLPENIGFTKRINQGATDIYNVVLNYSFGILYTRINHLLTVAGFDTKIGIFHTDITGKDSLLYDFIEQFRFISWEVVFSIFTKKIFNKNYLDEETRILTIDGRRVILEEMFKKLNKIEERNGEKCSYNELIKKKVYKLREELLENEIYNSL